MNKLQIAIIGGAVIVVVIAVLILIGALPGLRQRGAGETTLIMWGFEDERPLVPLTLKYREINSGVSVAYHKKDLAGFENEMLNALASGESPDVIVFPSDYIAKHKDKLSAAPSILMTEREIKQNFIDAASVFLSAKNEVLGIPFYANPLMLFANSDILTQNLVALPPKTWDDFLESAVKITKKDSAGNVILSGAALGRSLNIKNAPLTLAALLLQSGDKIINEKGDPVLGDPLIVGNTTIRPAESSLRFLADFANPKKTSQSWAAALPEAKEMFIGGKLAMYLGLLSEFKEIKNKNPHLAFFPASLPQLKEVVRPVTSGVLYALTVPRASQKQLAAWEFIKFLTSQESSREYADTLETVSVRRDLLPEYKKEAVRSVFAESVLYLALWPNQDPQKSDEILRSLIEDVASGKESLRDSLERARARLREIKN